MTAETEREAIVLSDLVHRQTLERLEGAMAPHLIPRPSAARRMIDAQGKEYWQAGDCVTALTEEACNRYALISVQSRSHINQEMKDIPWC
jgi:hypothetical protein